MLADFPVSPPVAERVRGDAEILSGFFDAEITIELVHLWNPPDRNATTQRKHKPCLTLPIVTRGYNHRRTNRVAAGMPASRTPLVEMTVGEPQRAIQRGNETLARPSG